MVKHAAQWLIHATLQSYYILAKDAKCRQLKNGDNYQFFTFCFCILPCCFVFFAFYRVTIPHRERDL